MDSRVIGPRLCSAFFKKAHITALEPPAMDGGDRHASGSSRADEKGNSTCNILLGFDPSDPLTDEPEEHVEKVQFASTICPVKGTMRLLLRLGALLQGAASMLSG